MTRRRLASAAAFWFAILALVLLSPQPSHASLGSFFSNLANRVGLTGTPGRMVLSFEDGRTYEGDTVNEKPHGSGVLVMPDGTRYAGDVSSGSIRGFGVVRDGWLRTYSGLFNNSGDLILGSYSFLGGFYSFEGQFAGLQPTGYGTLKFLWGLTVEKGRFSGDDVSSADEDVAKAEEASGKGNEAGVKGREAAARGRAAARCARNPEARACNPDLETKTEL